MHGRKETFGAVPSDGFFTSLVNCAVSTKEHWSLGVCYMWSVARGVTGKKKTTERIPYFLTRRGHAVIGISFLDMPHIIPGNTMCERFQL